MNIKDIAKLAGVGVSTVSRVINNHPDVKAETREKILGIIKESNYIPNNSARILKQNTSKNIGLFVKGVFNPFFSQMINIIGNRINEAGYNMILQQNDFRTKDDDIDNLIAFVKEKKLNGVICLGGNFLKITEDSFNAIEIPIVLASVDSISSKNNGKYSLIAIDNVKAAYTATKYLVENGHTEIACILGEKNDLGISYLRLQGYKKTLEKNFIDFCESNILIGNYNYKDAYKETMKILNTNKKLTAIFAISDIMAIGAAKAVIDSNLRIGDDISIIGFDGMDISEFYNPSIATIKQPQEVMAKNSIDLLLDIINNRTQHKHLILPTTLIKANSVKKIK
ncbi:LacI family DNA-binding transcriptional regulator [Desnuesiella massiliensis]|uniref:LacI family DNA-binding transcriptional regulator n=1 Tax=Desnuesiella massiliensis TaxID=1650662 RepID=UPI0006E1A987|nr:LacI family DNA-binding transcriptional regulator [Desnuesiella massiliensis]